MSRPLLSLTAAAIHNDSGQVVLRDIDFKLDQGEHVAILGVSGAGKSTLLHHLQQRAPERIALCPQQHGLVDALSCYNNIYIGGLARHHWWYNLINLIRAWPKNRREIFDICALLELDDQLFKSVDQLSGGQRQRVAIGRALYQRRSIFFGDETVASIDPIQAQRLLKILQDLHHSSVQVLHQRQLALDYCSRIIGLQDGRIVLDENTAKLTLSDLDALYES